MRGSGVPEALHELSCGFNSCYSLGEYSPSKIFVIFIKFSNCYIYIQGGPKRFTHLLMAFIQCIEQIGQHNFFATNLYHMAKCYKSYHSIWPPSASIMACRREVTELQERHTVSSSKRDHDLTRACFRAATLL